MNPRYAIPVIWILAGALVVKLWSAWSRLPGRVAVHFGMAMQPNGWSSKTALAAIVLIAVPGQAALATLLLLRVGGAAWPMVPVLVSVNVVLVCAFWETIRYNLEGTRFRPLWVAVPMILLFAAIAMFFLSVTVQYHRH